MVGMFEGVAREVGSDIGRAIDGVPRLSERRA